MVKLKRYENIRKTKSYKFKDKSGELMFEFIRKRSSFYFNEKFKYMRYAFYDLICFLEERNIIYDVINSKTIRIRYKQATKYDYYMLSRLMDSISEYKNFSNYLVTPLEYYENDEKVIMWTLTLDLSELYNPMLSREWCDNVYEWFNTNMY